MVTFMAEHEFVSGPTPSSSYQLRKDCRLCYSSSLTQVLELTPTPPANELLTDEVSSLNQDRFPLGLWQCQSCGHVQLPVIVDPDRIFRTYPYVSGTSPVFVDHLDRYASSVIESLAVNPGNIVVEVGSNDGTFLKFFKDSGMTVVGIDPARNVAKMASDSGIETIPEFMTDDVASNIVERFGFASLVVANNVFAHADDLRGMISAIHKVLHPSGVLVLEVQYLVDLCDKALFDMVYHEHMSYHHVWPLISFFKSFNMNLFDVERTEVHGGSIRLFVDKSWRNTPSKRLMETIDLERSHGLVPPLNGINCITDLGEKIASSKEAVQTMVNSIRASGRKIVGYGAPAKACTLSHHFGLNSSNIDFIVDDNPLKQGTYLPGSNIPIVHPDALNDESDFLMILAWNYADDIMSKPVCSSFKDRGGNFIVPFPVLKEI